MQSRSIAGIAFVVLDKARSFLILFWSAIKVFLLFIFQFKQGPIVHSIASVILAIKYRLWVFLMYLLLTNMVVLIILSLLEEKSKAGYTIFLFSFVLLLIKTYIRVDHNKCSSLLVMLALLPINFTEIRLQFVIFYLIVLRLNYFLLINHCVPFNSNLQPYPLFNFLNFVCWIFMDFFFLHQTSFCYYPLCLLWACTWGIAHLFVICSVLSPV